MEGHARLDVSSMTWVAEIRTFRVQWRPPIDEGRYLGVNQALILVLGRVTRGSDRITPAVTATRSR